MDDKTLAKEAIEARERSYSPYSNFMVGAALLAKSGRVYRGCNIENSGFSPSNCAERTAFFQAVSEGDKEFTAIAVAGWAKGNKNPGFAYPCGVCRQVMIEFCDPDTFRIIVTSGEDSYKSLTLGELLPHGFGPNSLNN
jgi:cytidine deaminase